MEVHAHSHPSTSSGHRKKWTHYFWEFLMLFLAVFCGFLAEYQLEHVIENQREKKYAKTMLEDLVNDTLDLSSDIPFWELYNSRVDSIRKEIEKSPSIRDHLQLYRLVSTLQNNNTFLYHDRTIGQLKNSGNFRLIRKKVVADSLIEYDARIRTIISNIQDGYNEISRDRREIQDQLFSSKFFPLRNTVEKFDSAVKLEPITISIRKGNEDLLFQYYNRLYTLKWLTAARIRFLKGLSEKAITLIGIIKKEYHLE
ncbi:MAG: hypothetical protein ABIR30_07920 [Chitinophagaceae bacterium]